MNYITINKDLILNPQSKSANMEVLLLCYIRTKCNMEGASVIGEKKMQDELMLAESTVEGYIKKLKEYKNILTIKTLNPSDRNDREEIEHILNAYYNGTERKKNAYYFHEPEIYYFLNPQFIYQAGVRNEVKGFLIRLACLCEPGTTKIYTVNCQKDRANISSIATDLKISKDKLKQLLGECEKLGLIKPIPRGYIILEDSFLLNLNKTNEDKVYNAIYRYCIAKGAVPPSRYEFDRRKKSIECDGLIILAPAIFNKWATYLQQAERTKEKALGFEEYIRDILLPTKFPTLPKEPHWEYFKKAILNLEPKKRQSLEMPPIFL